METVTIAILAKDKAHCLPLYLKCILGQTFPKDRTYLYIRTNNNTDNTTELLEEFITTYRNAYLDIYFDKSRVDHPLEQYKSHEWNPLRFAVLGQIRQESIEWAMRKNSHYFVVDCDNFIHPMTLESLLRTQLPVVGPFMVTSRTYYSNYHHSTTDKGYFLHNPEYHLIYEQDIKGLIQVDVIHCTYLVRKDILDKVSYLPDGTDRHEYVIFSEKLRQGGIQQYLDNRHIYGCITFAENREGLEEETWVKEFLVFL